ncbi:MAG: hypothetical protein WAW00_02240 [Candidatus Moraniibacteriota bacterium]
MLHSVTQRTAVLGIFTLLFVLVIPILFSERAQAAGLQQAYVRLDRLAASTVTSGMVCAKSATASVETTVKVTFPTGFATVDTAANWTVTTTNIPADATAWIGIGTASAASGQDVTFPSGDMVVGTLYCFNFSGTSTLTNAAAANDLVGTITTQLAGPTTIDSSNFALSTITNDQIVITATVPATFTVAFTDGTDPDGNANTDSFTANLSTTTVSTYGMTVTIATNAASGWVAWVKSANAALNSASTGATIATAGSVDNNDTDLAVDVSSGYILDVDITTDSGTGTGTVTQASGYGLEYAGANTTSGGTLSTTFQPVAASSGTTDGDVLTFIERARISAVQAAATDYTDTLTVVAAGRF